MIRIAILLLFGLSLSAQKRSAYGQSSSVSLANRRGTELGGNLVFVQGGTYDMGEGETLRRITVSSFYLDETEVCNRQYRNFVDWIREHQPSYPLEKLLPDTTVWRHDLPADKAELATRLAVDYFRLPAFDYHPVVGVSWQQAQEYCRWRSDRVNALLLADAGYIDKADANIFSTDKYLGGLYEGTPGPRPLINPLTGEERLVRWEDGLLLPNYRLPTEAEWEFAAQNTVYTEKHKSSLKAKVQAHARKHPLPDYYKQNQNMLPGHIFAGDKTVLFGMKSGVSEWVQDIYRPMTKAAQLRDVETTKPDSSTTQCGATKFPANSPIKTGDAPQLYLRRSKFYDAAGAECSEYEFLQKQANPASPHQIVRRDSEGNLRLKILSESEHKAFLQEQLQARQWKNARVYKGINAQGATLKSAADRAPQEGTSARSFIGFRCAMIRISAVRRGGGS